MDIGDIRGAVHVYSPDEIGVRSASILRIHGYKGNRPIPEAVAQSASEAADLAAQLFEPRVWYRQMPVVGLEPDILQLEKGVEFCSNAFCDVLAECRDVIVFVLTLGSRVDMESARLSQRGEVLEALFLENAGWLGINALTRDFAAHLSQTLKLADHGITRRMGPGYTERRGDRDIIWALEDQHKLFGLFDGTHLDVSLLESGAMSPRMSRSGLYGVERRST